MSIQAQTPDGVIHQFPDGTPDAAVDKAIKDYLAAAPKENAWHKAARIAGDQFSGATDAFKADVQTATRTKSPIDEAKPLLDVAVAASAPLKGAADAMFGDKPVHLPAKVLGLDVPEWAQNINANGLTGGDIATFGLGALGEAARAAQIARMAKGAGVTAKTAEQTLAASRGVTTPPVAPPVNSLAAHVAEFDKAGVRPSLATTSDGAAKLANGIAENALAGGASRANMAGQVQDVEQQAAKIARGYGAPAERASAGEAVQAGVKGFDQRFSDRAEAMYEPVFAKIGTAQEIAAQQAKNAADLQTARGGERAATTPTIEPKATAQALAEMNGRTDSPALKGLFSTPQVKTLTQAVADPASLSFKDLRSARTWVREAQKDEALRQGVSQSDLQRLEGALTQDINTNAEALAGPQVARQLKQADQFYRLGSQRIQGALQAFVGKNDAATAESAYDRIVRAAGTKGGADSSRLLALRKSLQPGEWGDVVASVVDRLGAATSGAANANEAGAFSLNNFVSNYANLSERGKATLFGGADKDGLRTQLDALAQVAGKVKAVEKGANASKSGVSMQNMGTLGTLSGTVTAAALGHPVPLALELGGIGALNLTGRVLTDPTAVRWLARLGNAEKASPAALSSTVGRLRVASATNPALAPLYEQSQKLLPKAQLPAAATTSPAPETPGLNR